MSKKDFFKTLPLIVLVLSIGFSPRFHVGVLNSGKPIDLRIEDFVLLFLGMLWLCEILLSNKLEFKKPPLFTQIILWLSLGFISILVNLIFANLYVSRAFFFFLKEIEYFFLFFYVFYHIKSLASAKLLLNLWIFIGFINVAWIIFELISGVRITYYYGPTPLMEPEGTFPAGGFFLIVFTFLFNMFLYYYATRPISSLKKKMIYALIACVVVGILSSGSRGSFVGLIAALAVSIFLYYIRKGIPLTFYAQIGISIILICSLFLFSSSGVLKRFSNLSEIQINLDPSNPLSRPGIWAQQIGEAIKHPFFLLIGYGKSAILKGVGESHSQYVRNFVEVGLLGSFLFFCLLYAIIKQSFHGFLGNKDAIKVGVSAGLFCCTIAMIVISLSAEGFVVVKISEAYWFFAALTFAVLNFNTQHDQESIAIS